MANAALFDRGHGIYYDDVLNVSWLQDANYARSQYVSSAGALGDADGKMNWNEAITWVDSLTFAGYDDWRLPSVSPVNGVDFNLTYSDTGSADFGYNLGTPSVTGNPAALAPPMEPAGARASAAGWRRRDLSSSGA